MHKQIEDESAGLKDKLARLNAAITEGLQLQRKQEKEEAEREEAEREEALAREEEKEEANEEVIINIDNLMNSSGSHPSHVTGAPPKPSSNQTKTFQSASLENPQTISNQGPAQFDLSVPKTVAEKPTTQGSIIRELTTTTTTAAPPPTTTTVRPTTTTSMRYTETGTTESVVSPEPKPRGSEHPSSHYRPANQSNPEFFPMPKSNMEPQEI